MSISVQKTHNTYVEPRYLAEAKELLALITCGQERGYHVRGGYSCHRKGSYEPLRESMAVNHWLPARFLRDRQAGEPDIPRLVEEPRILSAHTVANHLLGKGWVGVAPPSWLSWFALDIDLPKAGENGAMLSGEEAQRRCDAVLSSVWDAFDFGSNRLPVVLQTPGGGYHVYVPLSRKQGDANNTWPAHVIRERVTARLHAAGLQLRDGHLELWPTGKVLRLPMGRQMCLLEAQNPDDSDCLGLVPIHAKWGERMDRHTKTKEPCLRRDIGPGVRAFLDAFETARKPLHEWLYEDESNWSETWGPWGDTPPSQNEKNLSFTARNTNLLQQYEEGEGSPDGWLLRGARFQDRIVTLLKEGLTECGGRHDAALKLTYYFGVGMGLSEDRSMIALTSWLKEFPHVSNFLKKHGERNFIIQTIREARHYYRNVVACIGGLNKRQAFSLGMPLGDDFVPFVDRFSAPAVEQAAFSILRFLKGFADSDGIVREPREMTSTLLRKLCGSRFVGVNAKNGGRRRVRATQLAIEELTKMGVLTLYKQYRVNHHGRHFCCWYQFGSGALPSQKSEGEIVLAEVSVDEGQLEVVAKGEVMGRAGVKIAAGAGCTVVPGWVERMYARHNFAPGDLKTNLEHQIGGFRDYSVLREKTEENGDLGERETGTVVTFADDSGYGFIESDFGGAQLFVHQTSVCVKGFRSLRAGQKVEYTRAKGGKGLKALWVNAVRPE